MILFILKNHSKWDTICEEHEWSIGAGDYQVGLLTILLALLLIVSSGIGKIILPPSPSFFFFQNNFYLPLKPVKGQGTVFINLFDWFPHSVSKNIIWTPPNIVFCKCVNFQVFSPFPLTLRNSQRSNFSKWQGRSHHCKPVLPQGKLPCELCVSCKFITFIAFFFPSGPWVWKGRGLCQFLVNTKS